MIELCGRTAYKSEDRITETSARSFVLMLKKHEHLSVLEHSNIVLRVADRPGATRPGALADFERSLMLALGSRNAYHRFASLDIPEGNAFAVAGNVRSWLETVQSLTTRDPATHRFLARALRRFFPILFETSIPEEEHALFDIRIMDEAEQVRALKSDLECDLPVFVFRFTCDRGITHEVVRHRVLSFTQESTRYVNYGNKGMVLILPEELEPYFDAASGELRPADAPLVREWTERAGAIFAWYRGDLERGLRPEIARDILPNLLKSEILVSGRFSGWKHFVGLRDAKQAHPRIRTVARKVRQYFETQGFSFA
jgi:flavin-dependent thymidylate synthase